MMMLDYACVALFCFVSLVPTQMLYWASRGLRGHLAHYSLILMSHATPVCLVRFLLNCAWCVVER